MCHRVCVVASTARHDDMTDSFLCADTINQFDQPRITRCRVFCDGIYKFKFTVRNFFCECLDICIELICNSSVHVTHLKGCHCLSRNYIFLSRRYGDLSDSKYKCIAQFSCTLFCCNDQLCHSDKCIFSVYHHRRSCMIAHAFSCHFIADHTDDSADNTDIKIRIIEFIALFDMIFQITFILADISLCSFNFLRTAVKLC